MSKKKGNGKIIAAAVIAAGMVAGTVAAGIILPQTNYVNITCYGNNGTVVEQRVRKNSAVVLPTPERDGFNFDGWYLNEEMTDAVTYGAKFNKNTKVYAGWELTANALADDATTLAETVGITKIGAGAFKGCTGLTNVTIPASVTTIGTGAFEGCNIANLYIEGDIYKTATSANSLGGALTAAQNIFVNNEVELSCRNDYFLAGNTLYYMETVNGYTHFTKDSQKEKRFKTNYYHADATTIIIAPSVKYRGTGTESYPMYQPEITATGVMKEVGWYTSPSGETKATLTEIMEDKNFYMTKIKATFSECTWGQIKQVSDNHWGEGCFAVGDEKVITINDTAKNLTFDLTIQIADFDHDIDENGNEIGITCVTKELLPSKYNHNMNAASGGYQDGDNIGGWDEAEMRTYLNNDIYNLLPTDLKSSITSAIKKSTIGNASTTTNSSTDKLFLLSMAEINVYTNSAGYKYEGAPYALYADWPTSSGFGAVRSKYYADSDATGNWWLRSPAIGSSDSFWYVYSSGYLGDSGAYILRNICFAFCI